MTPTQIQEEISREVAQLPPEAEQEVLSFVRFLRNHGDLSKSDFERLLYSFTHDNLFRGSYSKSSDAIAVEINKTEGVNGGAASIGATRIAVWMLEEARREGLSDGEILAMYPQLDARHLVLAWWYVATHQAEVELAMQQNDEG